MTEQEVLGLLGMDKSLSDELPELTADQCGRLRFLLRTDWQAFLEAARAMPSPEGSFLRFALLMAGEARAQYRQMGIDDEIWRDTFSDIRIWSDKYRRETGKAGIQEIVWISHHLTLRIFRLGRLQFEPSLLGQAVMFDGRELPADTPTLEVHIAEGEPLLHTGALDSYERAKAFFRNPRPFFVCRSWLLSPALASLLPPESNILAFQRDFTIFEQRPESRQAEERIFGAPLDDYSAYPETTSLQRKAKAWLLSGKKIPSGSGIHT